MFVNPKNATSKHAPAKGIRLQTDLGVSLEHEIVCTIDNLLWLFFFFNLFFLINF